MPNAVKAATSSVGEWVLPGQQEGGSPFTVRKIPVAFPIVLKTGEKRPRGLLSPWNATAYPQAAH